MKVTATELRQLLSYSPHTGVFRWRKRQGRQQRGTVAGSINKCGYRRIKLFGKLYPASHLAWLYHSGYYPEYEIDHINNNRDDNRLCNLRDVPHSVNQHNRRDTKANGYYDIGYYYRHGLPVPPEVRRKESDAALVRYHKRAKAGKDR